MVLLAAGAGGLLWWRRRPVPAPPVAVAPAPLPGRPRLVKVIGGSLRHGEDPGPIELLLPAGRLVVGRAKDADVHLDDLSVSPRHALLTLDPEGHAVVRDLGSLNGLFVDGIPVAERELYDGNRLQLGNVRLVYRTDPENDSGGRQGGELGESSGG